jgi:hypothetical protein
MRQQDIEQENKKKLARDSCREGTAVREQLYSMSEIEKATDEFERLGKGA